MGWRQPEPAPVSRRQTSHSSQRQIISDGTVGALSSRVSRERLWCGSEPIKDCILPPPTPLEGGGGT
ncbi:hypothetical protein AAFF_G00024010 [Aldrovandia affinis]|uniref:Uncharacterized protein n=1 Tax=Aldrovandia affinis TaxID=143900 RepID=A0AAD7T618_9TELE|nr:hypothetical protein AAFF_G00024010 [Aldrovandia affinis]